MISRVDYCNSVLAGISGRIPTRLQSILNAAARLVFKTMMREPITPLLSELHWLRVPERIEFRLSSWRTAVFRAQLRHTSRVVFTGPRRTLHVAVCAQQTPLRYSFRQLDAQPLRTVRSSWLRRGRGTHCYPPCVVVFRKSFG